MTTGKEPMTRRRARLYHAIALLAAPFASPTLAEAKCITPLTDVARRDPKEFTELEKLGPPIKELPTKASGVLKYQVPKTGEGDINIDFYWVTFTRPKNITGKEFFKKIRLKYSDFATGSDASFAFGPYETSDLANDVVRQINREKWEADDPLGALMSFKLIGFPFARLKAGVPSLAEKNGDVQVICSSDLDFVFVTVKSKLGDMHPVAGYRGFGLIADPDADTWTFYSKAIDRNSGYGLNWPAYWNTRNVYDRNNLFCKGHRFWIEFFGEFQRFVEREGMQVKDWNMSNHGPVEYPLVDGTGPWKPLDCGTQTTPKK